MFWHWLNHVMGNDYGQPYGSFSFYNLWSGIAGALPDILLITGLAAWYVHRTCHVNHCYRPGRHEVAGTPFKCCRKHHPAIDGKVTAQVVASAHAEGRQ
jgi:hypothetical protein